MSMNSSSGVAATASKGLSVCSANSSAHPGESTLCTGTSPSFSAASSSACAFSVSTSWQSASRMSRARAEPRRTGLRPMTTAPLSAAAPSTKENSGTLSSSTPTWKGRSLRRRERSSAARSALACTCCAHDHSRSSNRSPGRWSSALTSSWAVMVVDSSTDACPQTGSAASAAPMRSSWVVAPPSSNSLRLAATK